MERSDKMRVYKKKSSFVEEKLNSIIIYGNQDYKIIYENVKTYVVYKISITTNLKERLAYLDVLDYMEKIQTETK